jgi:hypothetical protein
MPRRSLSIKGPSLHRSKKAKLLEYVPRETYRGTRDVPVKVSDMVDRPKARKKARIASKAKINSSSQHETPPQPMDIDETFWAGPEEPVMPTASEKKVRKSTSLPQRASCISSPSTTILKSLPRRLTPTYAAFLIPKVSR